MKKVHTRVKRRLGLSTHLDHYEFFHPQMKKHRPKTFKTEDAAKIWAKSHGLGQYSLKKVKHNKRFQIIVQNGKSKD